MVFIRGVVETFIKVTTRTIWEKAMGRCTGQMAVITKANGEEAINKVKAYYLPNKMEWLREDSAIIIWFSYMKRSSL